MGSPSFPAPAPLKALSPCYRKEGELGRKRGEKSNCRGEGAGLLIPRNNGQEKKMRKGRGGMKWEGGGKRRREEEKKAVGEE